MNSDRIIDVFIIGGGPLGIATAIEATKHKLTHCIVEKGALVNSIYHFPQNMTFFSTSEKLEIGSVPFMSIHDKPTRLEALEYYRRVVEHWNLSTQLYETVTGVEKVESIFQVHTTKANYKAKSIVVATGFYSTPNLLNIPGEELEKVSHYYNQPHPYLQQKVAVIGAGNSACQVALELYHKGVDVTMIIRGSAIKETVKYWIKPNIENRIKENAIQAYFNATVTEITPTTVHFQQHGTHQLEIENDYVLAMTGYQPDYAFLHELGIQDCDDEFQTPLHNQVQETNVKGIYLAGVVCGGMKTNRFIIENSKQHAEVIIQSILKSNLTM